MTAMNNLLTLRIDQGAANSTGAFSAIAPSMVVPNKATETIDNLKVLLETLLAGDLINATLRCDVGPTAATGTFTVSSGSGTLATVINGVTINTTWASSDNATATAIAANINASTNALVAGLVTASAATNVVTVTSTGSALGVSGNCITTTASGTGYTAQQARLTGGTDSYPAVAAATATGTLTISSGSGTISAIINGVTVSVTWATSDSNTGDLLVAAIKANTNINNRVTASNSSGTVTISAKSTGSWGNTVSLSGTGTGVTITNTTKGFLQGGTDPAIGYAEVAAVQPSQTDTISGSDTGTYAVVVGGITATATGTGNDTTTGDAIVTAILASSLAGYVKAVNASGTVTVTALENGPWAGTLGNVVPFSVTGTGASAGGSTLANGANAVTCRWTF